MYRIRVCCLVVIVQLISVLPAAGVLREWDDEGATLNWTEATNWTGDGVPENADDVVIGSLADAHDDAVVFDANADVVRSLTLENGADFDTDGGRIVATVDVSVGEGSASGTTKSELVIRRRNGTGDATFAVDANSMSVGANGHVSLVDGGRFELDGTGVQPGVLSLADGGTFVGFGEISLTDSDASLGALSSLVDNSGAITVEDPLFMGVGEPTATTLSINAPNAPTFAQFDFAGTNGTGTVNVTRNATLMLDSPFIGPERLTLAANSVLQMASAGSIPSDRTIEVNSGILNEGGVNELPAVPAMISGDGLLNFAGIIRINVVDEELIVETPIDATDGLIANRGTLRLRGGGNIRAVDLDDLGLGSVVNESTEILEFQGGQNYNTEIANDGSLGLDPFGGSATVQFNDFTQGGTGTLGIDVGGDLDGEFDVLTVVDDATLDGTLEVALADMFEPALGSTYTILTAQNGAVTGQFSTTELPEFDGRTFEVIYNPTSVELQVISTGSLNGDFDMDGDVDGADFLLWQQGGSPMPLSAADLAEWQANYPSAPPAEVAAAVVPEPTALCSLAVAVLLGATARRF